MNNKQLMEIYNAMLDEFGQQNWWPGDTPFEIAIGAILTQNTNWGNVEKAITNLRNADLIDAYKLDELDIAELAELIRPAGYFNIKAKRLKNFIHWFCERFGGDFEQLKNMNISSLREELISINGIGPETADSIILYALEKPTFVVDTYTHRIFTRHGFLFPESDYEQTKDFFESNLETDTKLFNEYHALIVCVGKNYCKPKPKCDNCPLNFHPHQVEIEMY